MRKINVVLAIILMLGQFYFDTSSAFAAGNSNENPATLTKNGKPENYKGTILSVETDGLIILQSDNSKIPIAINNDTRIKIPSQKNVSVTDLKLGMSAIVQARRYADGSLVAQQIHAKAPKFANAHHIGIVSTYTAGKSIAITNQDGDTVEFKINATTSILPEGRAADLAVGTHVTIISTNDEEKIVIGIVIHPNVP